MEQQSLKPLTDEEKNQECKAIFFESIKDKDLKIWLDTDRLLLGWYKTDHQGQRWIMVRAIVQTKTQTLVAVPLRKESLDVAWSRPWMAQQVRQKCVDNYRLIIPRGTF